MERAKVRPYVDHPLGQGQPVALSRERAHCLFGVMRFAGRAGAAPFNGRDGERTAEVGSADRKGAVLAAGERVLPCRAPPGLWPMFAPVRKARTDFLIETAEAPGVARICPVQSAFSKSERERLPAPPVEAVEQCGAVFVPEGAEPVRVLAEWPAGRRGMFCGEGIAAVSPGLAALLGAEREAGGEPWAVFVGPEGDLSGAERDGIGALRGAAALALWQAAMGDWP